MFGFACAAAGCKAGAGGDGVEQAEAAGPAAGRCGHRSRRGGLPDTGADAAAAQEEPGARLRARVQVALHMVGLQNPGRTGSRA